MTRRLALVAMSEPTLRRAIWEDVPEIRALTLAAYAKWVGVTPRPPRPVTADYDRAFRDHRFDLLVEGGKLVAFIETVAEGAELLIVNVAVDLARQREIGRAHVCTPVTNAHLVCRFLIQIKNKF